MVQQINQPVLGVSTPQVFRHSHYSLRQDGEQKLQELHLDLDFSLCLHLSPFLSLSPLLFCGLPCFFLSLCSLFVLSIFVSPSLFPVQFVH